MNKEMESLFYELKQVLVQHSSKWNTLCDIEQYILDLQHQLEEKDKIIDELLNDSCYTNECPIELDNFTKENEKEFKCENCQDDYKKCWLKYFENKISERNKNGK